MGWTFVGFGGGFRQFSALLRKNVLLKCRRPCSTVVEFTMAVTLFILIAYLRTIYPIEWHGPFFFNSAKIYPMNDLVFNTTTQSQALVDSNDYREKCTENCEMDWEPGQEKEINNAVDQTSLFQSYICATSFADTIASAVDQALWMASNWFGPDIMDLVSTNLANFEDHDQVDSLIGDFCALESMPALNLTKMRQSFSAARSSLSSSMAKMMEGSPDHAFVDTLTMAATEENIALISEVAKALNRSASEVEGLLANNLTVNSALDFQKNVRAAFEPAQAALTKTQGYVIVADIVRNFVSTLSKDIPDLSSFLPGMGSIFSNSNSMNNLAEDDVRETLVKYFRGLGSPEALAYREMLLEMSTWVSHFSMPQSAQAAMLENMFGDGVPSIDKPFERMSAAAQDIRSNLQPKHNGNGRSFKPLRKFMMADNITQEVEKFLDLLQVADNPFEAVVRNVASWMGLDYSDSWLKANVNPFGNKTLGELFDDLAEYNSTQMLAEDAKEWMRNRTVSELVEISVDWLESWFQSIDSSTLSMIKGMVQAAPEMTLGSLADSLNDETMSFKGVQKDICQYKALFENMANRIIEYSRDKFFSMANLTSLSKRIRNEIDKVPDPSCLRKEPSGCQSQKTEAECLASVDDSDAVFGNTALRGQICAWCTLCEKCMPKDLVPSAIPKANIKFSTRRCLLSTAIAQGIVDDLINATAVTCESKEKAGIPEEQRRPNDIESKTYLERELARRKVLIAPYKGDVKEFIDLMIVEFMQSAMVSENSTSNFLTAIVESSMLRAGLAQMGKSLFQDRFIFMEDLSGVEEYARNNGDDILLALEFRSADPQTGNFPPGPVNIDYAIRLHAQLLPPTRKIWRLRGALIGDRGGMNPGHAYMQTYFVHIQEVIGRAAARMQALRDVSNYEDSPLKRNMEANNKTEKARAFHVALEEFPVSRFEGDYFIYAIQYMLPMLMILGWIYAVTLLIREIVYEKQELLRDVMRIMGLKTWVYWSSWMASAMIQMTILSLIVTLFMTLPMGSQHYAVIRRSNPLPVFLFFWLYSISVVSLSMLVSSFFSRAKVAAACGGLVYYVLFLPYNAWNRYDDVLGTSWKNVLCLLSPTALGAGSAIIARWEVLGEGLQWSNVLRIPPLTNSGSLPTDSHTFGHVCIMLVVDCVLYQVLAWYVEKVRPGTLGLPQPWYFPALKSYWLPPNPGVVAEITGDEVGEKNGNKDALCWEPAPASAKVAVKMRNLSKTFRGGKKALQGVNLDMHVGMITGYLGHNGAGKTTTMGILTGLFPPTTGDIQVHGVSVFRDSIGVRRQLGVCLQHNALYEVLTVEEHLQLFCCLKGVPKHLVKQETEKLVSETGMQAKLKTHSSSLSGGMKRKLSIMISLCGGSRVIALDEPTAGVDAKSRRDIWTLLSKRKANTSILLATHFMDEADILSDRIAVIASGKLTAIGSPLELKRQFADSYTLTFLIKYTEPDIPRLTKLVVTAVPAAICVGTRGAEVTYKLPARCTAQFPALFKELQDDKVLAARGIESYNLKAASMEEVFLQTSSMFEVGLKGTVRNMLKDTNQREITDLKEASTDIDINAMRHGEEVHVFSTSDVSPETDAVVLVERSIVEGPTNLDEVVPERLGREDSKATADQDLKDTTKVEDCEPSKQESSTKDEAHSTETPMSLQCMTVETISPQDSVPTAEITNETCPISPISSDGMELKNEDAKLTGWPLAEIRFDALFRKRLLSVRRDSKAWASQLVFPGIFLCLAMMLAKIQELRRDSNIELKLAPDMFVSGKMATGDKTSFFVSGSNPDPLAKELESVILNGGSGTSQFELFDETQKPLPQYVVENRRKTTRTVGSFSTRGTIDDKRLILWHHRRAYHGPPVMVDMWNNARLRFLGYPDARVQGYSHALPKTEALIEEELSGRNQVLQDFGVAVTVVLAMGFIPASFLVHVVHEKATHGKHQQLLTGVTAVMYWVSNYVWDICNFLVPLVIVLLILAVMNVSAFSGSNIAPMTALIFLYGAAQTPQMYCTDIFFRTPSTAYVTMVVTNIFTGTVSLLTVIILSFYEEDLPGFKSVRMFFEAWFPWVLPNYCLGQGMLRIASNHYKNDAFDKFGFCWQNPCTVSPFAYDVVGEFLVHLVIMAPVWLLLRICLEVDFFSRQLKFLVWDRLRRDSFKPSPRSEMEQTVVAEIDRVDKLLQESQKAGTRVADALVFAHIRKSFGCRKPCHAVRDISTRIPGGECFGLLGVNGAGKTTTMRMITGHVVIDAGDILVNGYSVKHERQHARQHLGYCPQFDALPDKLTVFEALMLYARLRGVQRENLKKTAEQMISLMCLEDHRKQMTQHLSGGNKRKLSTALSLIGFPDVILLDEPSTGVDVGARRFLWDIIGNIRKSNRAILLTSHSMEECEVLCTRLTIMVHGQYQCLGAPSHLLHKFGGGYIMAVKVILPSECETPSASAADPVQTVQNWIAAKVPEANLTEKSIGLLRYRLGKTKGNEFLPLGDIFQMFEKSVQDGGELSGCISDYSISQTSLEEVFLYFSNLAESNPQVYNAEDET